MKISIICPLYNAEDYIEDLYLNIKKQKDVWTAPRQVDRVNNKKLWC